MRIRNSRLRTKIAALLLSLTALWAFAAWVTIRDGVNLLWVSTYDSNLSSPADPLLVDLQQERRDTVVWLSRPLPARHRAMLNQRARTDKTIATFEEKARSGALRRAADDDLRRRVDDVLDRLDGLRAERASIDRQTIGRVQGAAVYTSVIESFFRMYDAMGTLDDEKIAKDTGNLIDLNRSREILSQEDALLAGALAVGRVTQDDLTQFVRLAGVRGYVTAAATAQLEREDRVAFQQVTESGNLSRVQSVETAVSALRPGRTGVRPAIDADQWRQVTQPAIAELRAIVKDAGNRLIDKAKPVAAGVILRLVLAGGLGLLAVIASVIVSVTTARALVRQLERLRSAAWELAEQRLPGVVERLGHGEKVDVAVEAPPLEFGRDEIGQVGHAFNAVQETAIRTAVEQAELRRGIRDVLLSLARRTQTLVHRQLTMLDTMERRRDIETKQLEELFRLDHLATRMRRNAENLIVLSGALPARGWRNSVPMVDVVRAAVGEVEDYTRVTVLPFGPVELAGRAVGDLTHLLAELIENAVSFSPPETVVQVGGHLVASGFAIDIEDRGLGMTDEKLAEINERIADPPDFNLQSSVQLGLFVVSRLAERYNAQVSLKRSAYGGTTAVVVIPRDLIVEQAPAPVEPATTQNGLEVRRPAAIAAAAAGATRATGPQPVAPALIAVPTTPEPKPEPEHAPEHAPAPLDGDAGPHPQPEDQPPVPDISVTPSGLPVRVPQANLAGPLRADPPAAADVEPDEHDDPGRSPAEIQRIMGSYQRGTRRGRTEAARTEDTARTEGTTGTEGPTGTEQRDRILGTNAAEGEEDQ
ncbi:nitrate- and nitrite sensing domain-containing protein [Spirillospora sp. NBC_00431]